MAKNSIQRNSLFDEHFWHDYFLILLAIRASKIEDTGNILCEQKSPKLSQDTIDFMKATLLADIEFEIPTEGFIFYIKNRSKDTKMPFSGRYGCSELRGEALRQQITAMMKNNNQLSLYDALSSCIMDPEFSFEYRYFLHGNPDLDETTKAILLKCSRKLLPLMSNNEEESINKIKAVFDEQFHEYFQNCPASLKKLSAQLQDTAKMLGRLLIQAYAKKTQDEAEITELSTAIRTTYKLMPAYYDDGRIVFPENYNELVVEYNTQAQNFANNPAYVENTSLRAAGFAMLGLGVVALSTFALVMAFPPAALLIGQLALQTAFAVGTIKAGIASAGILSAGLGLFAAKQPGITAEKNMQSLTSLATDAEKELTAPNCGQ